MPNLYVDGTVTIGGNVGFNGQAPATLPASVTAVTLTAPTLTVFGFTTTAQFFALINAVNSIITALKNQGLMTSP